MMMMMSPHMACHLPADLVVGILVTANNKVVPNGFLRANMMNSVHSATICSNSRMNFNRRFDKPNL